VRIPIFQLPFTDKEIAEVQEGVAKVLRSNILTKGSVAEQFEKEWAKYCGVKYAVACSAGTAALEMIYRAIGVEGKSVIIPSNTFIGTAVGLIRAGGKVILADCEKETLQLSLKSAMEAHRPDTIAIVLVHIGGYIRAELDLFKQWCDKEGLWLIEDAAHAHGAEYGGRKAGSLADVAGFSFFPTKVMTCGEGGMVTTDNEELYHKCVSLHNQGRRADNPQIHDWLGYNWRLDEIRAVLGLQQVRKADKIVAERRQIVGWYDRKLHGYEDRLAIHPPQTAPCNPAFYKYIVLLPDILDRDTIRSAMQAKDIAMPGLVYEIPLHRQPAMQQNPVESWLLPNTDWVSQHHLCLPLYLGMTEVEVDYVVDSLKEILDE